MRPGDNSHTSLFLVLLLFAVACSAGCSGSSATSERGPHEHAGEAGSQLPAASDGSFPDSLDHAHADVESRSDAGGQRAAGNDATTTRTPEAETAHGDAGSAGVTDRDASTGGELVAFPGAEGFGRLATGARGGAVYHVENLNDTGPGSLRDAISVPHRTVVFDVSGVVKLGSRLVFSSNLTVAGQTAPGGGVTVYGNGSSFTNANHTIVRYLRFRMGAGGESGKDTIAIARGHDMIFDHCSISWGRDGTFDLNQESGYELGNVTLQDSIVAQGLQTHSTGGLLVADGVSVLRSLYIDNNSRNPKARQTTQWVNNVVYNWVVSGYILGDTSGRSDGYLVGNYFIPGPETHGGTLDSPTPTYHLHAAGNYYDTDKNGVLDGRPLEQGDFGSVTWEAVPSVSFPQVTELSAQQAFAHVAAHAGASRWRDEADRYVLAELESLGKQGATISNESALGLTNGVGVVPSAATPLDTDRDGMPDDWEREHGLSPTDPDDRNGDRNQDGWTNLEEYINGLAT